GRPRGAPPRRQAAHGAVEEGRLEVSPGLHRRCGQPSRAWLREELADELGAVALGRGWHGDSDQRGHRLTVPACVADRKWWCCVPNCRACRRSRWAASACRTPPSRSARTRKPASELTYPCRQPPCTKPA